MHQVRSKKYSWRQIAGLGDPLAALGEPYVWITGGALIIAISMIVGIMLLIFTRGLLTFWPQPLIQVETKDHHMIMGEFSRAEKNATNPGASRRLLRTGNYDLSGSHFTWITQSDIVVESRPKEALVIERKTWGRFYGMPAGFVFEGKERQTTSAPDVKAFLKRYQPKVAEDLAEHRSSPQELSERFKVVLKTADGQSKVIPLTEVTAYYFPNDLSLAGKIKNYLERWQEFLFEGPREANSEGGVFPAIFGTICMTLLMSIFVVPFGVMAALYLREYAKDGLVVRMTRISISNLAAVPSIVFGVFGLGFFCYFCGASIDQIFFRSSLPNPTFGKGALLWASLTLALLTLPVVIVATEEALAAVPNSLRQGSFACGASHWQTIRRIVLPRALPGIMTGMILAIARGAGEVAPLMLVGAAKMAPNLPVDGQFPFLHPERSFMHLGFHIFDLAFQSQNSEAAVPKVFTTTLLLILIVLSLNLIAILIRSRLKKAYVTGNNF